VTCEVEILYLADFGWGEGEGCRRNVTLGALVVAPFGHECADDGRVERGTTGRMVQFGRCFDGGMRGASVLRDICRCDGIVDKEVLVSVRQVQGPRST
jgi:hypothetical protein